MIVYFVVPNCPKRGREVAENYRSFCLRGCSDCFCCQP